MPSDVDADGGIQPEMRQLDDQRGCLALIVFELRSLEDVSEVIAVTFILYKVLLGCKYYDLFVRLVLVTLPKSQKLVAFRLETC